MLIIPLYGLLLAVSVSAFPGLLHDKPHQTLEVLDNIHNTPYCAYTCVFNEKYPVRFAPECQGSEGQELGACLCLANGYQYMLDQCIGIKCPAEDRKIVPSNTTH